MQLIFLFFHSSSILGQDLCKTPTLGWVCWCWNWGQYPSLTTLTNPYTCSLAGRPPGTSSWGTPGSWCGSPAGVVYKQYLFLLENPLVAMEKCLLPPPPPSSPTSRPSRPTPACWCCLPIKPNYPGTICQDLPSGLSPRQLPEITMQENPWSIFVWPSPMGDFW